MTTRPSSPPPQSAAALPEPMRGRARAAWIVLALLLGILALRMTISESVQDTLRMQLAAAQHATGGSDEAAAPSPGPGTTTGLFALTVALAGAAALLRPVRRAEWIALLLIAVLALLLAGSTTQAQWPYGALLGACDVLTGIVAGWAVGVLCAGSLKARRLVVCVLTAILAAWVLKGLLQWQVEYPELLELYRKNPAEMLKSVGLTPGTPSADAFYHRLKSQELSGFINFSNVFANGLIGFAVMVAGLLAALAMFRRQGISETPARLDRPQGHARGPEVPPHVLWLVLLALLAVGALGALFLTESKGANAACVLCLLVLAAGIAARRWLARHRWTVAAAALALLVLGALAVVGYGIRHDALPSKSLLFRWHYWTATVPMIREHPAWGVGLNNYGDYYSSLKRPSSPEDVKDPHAFFVRYAAEAGLPAAATVGALVLLMALRAVRRWPDRLPDAADDVPLGTALASGGVLCGLWWTARFAVADPRAAYFLYMDLIMAVVSFGGFMLAWAAQRELTANGLRVVGAALTLGAVGMLLYDQVNMALVTGPVAMMFWIMLGAGGANEPADMSSDAPRLAARASAAAGVALLAAGVALALGVWLPVVRTTLPFDTARYEQQYIHAALHGDGPAALAALDAALARHPRSGELLRARIDTKLGMKLPAADDILRMFALDRANARIRMELAVPSSDLPAPERIAALRDALWLDTQLPAAEAKRLTPAERATIDHTIHDLETR